MWKNITVALYKPCVCYILVSDKHKSSIILDLHQYYWNANLSLNVFIHCALLSLSRANPEPLKPQLNRERGIPYPHGEATRAFLAQQLRGELQELPADMSRACADSLGRQTRSRHWCDKEKHTQEKCTASAVTGIQAGELLCLWPLCCAFPGSAEMSHPERWRGQLTASWEGRKSSGVTWKHAKDFSCHIQNGS